MNDSVFMRQRPVLPLLTTMALPMVVSMLVNSLYNIVDTYYVSQISDDAMTALSLVYPVQNFINAVAIGFGVGINAVIAYHLGAREEEQADRAATHSLVLSVLHGLLLMVVCIAMMPAFLSLFTPSEAVVELGVQYSTVAFSFSVIIMLGLTFEKIFQATGDMKVPMISLMCGCVANIVLDPLMIFGLGQSLSLAIYLAVYLRRSMGVHIRACHLRLRRQMCLRLYAIGVPAILNLALPSFLISALNAILSAYSQVYILVLGAYYKLQTFLYLPANGMIQGMRPVISYNYGAGEHGRVRQIYRTVLVMTGVIMAMGTLLFLSLPGQLTGIFTENPQAIRAGETALRLISVGFIASAVSVTTSGALEGLGKGLPSLLISLARYILILIPAAFLLSRAIGPTGVWHAFWITEAAAAVFSLLVYRRAVTSR